MEKLTIYEAHVYDLTAHCQHVEPEHRGTFYGACHPHIIDHLLKLGVNCIQFMPVFDCVETHWGYDTKSWFDLNPKYGTLNDFILMCAVFRSNGIKVVLDVVYNHLHGNHPEVSYGDKGFSGCGDDVRVDRSLHVVQRSIDYWMDLVDGMRFDLAPVLFRENNQFNPNGRFAHYIKQHADDGKIIICEPWDCGGYVDHGKYGGYFVGRFPEFCLEHNDKIRDSVRTGDSYWCGRHYERYVGFVTCHDGMTLADLVSYNEKHNEINGESNRDGSNCNYSYNHGVEGKTTDKAILAAREASKQRMMKQLKQTAYHVMLLMGDEFGRTQDGCNNGYKHPCPVIWP